MIKRWHVAVAIIFCGGLQLKVLSDFAAASNGPSAAVGLHAALTSSLMHDGPETNNATGAAVPDATKDATTYSNATIAPNVGGAKAETRRIYCPRCNWNHKMSGKKALCHSRRSYLLGKDPNETQVDTGMREAHPSCYIEHVTLVKRPSAVGAPRNVDPRRGVSGRWVRDRDYARRNAFMDHVKFWDWGLANTKEYSIETALLRNATAWRWADDNAPVTEATLDGFCKVCHHLGVARLFLVGDSLSQDFRRSLEAHLGFSHPGLYTITRLFDKMVYEHFQLPCEQSVPGFDGVFVAFRKINGLNEAATGALEVAGGGTPEFVASHLNGTAVVWNVGAHMKNLGEYRAAFDAVLGWIDRWSQGEGGVDPGRLHVFFRETVPGHPGCHPRGTAESNTNMIDKVVREKFDAESAAEIHRAKFEMLKADGTAPFVSYRDYAAHTRREMEAQSRLGEEGRTWRWFDFQHANGTFEAYNAYSREVLEGRRRRTDLVRVHWLNVYNATVLRRDGHKAFGDCLHYLQPGPYSFWVHMFYSALLDLAGLRHHIA